MRAMAGAICLPARLAANVSRATSPRQNCAGGFKHAALRLIDLRHSEAIVFAPMEQFASPFFHDSTKGGLNTTGNLFSTTGWVLLP